MTSTRTVVVASDLETLSQQAAHYIVQTATAAVARDDRCTLALAGGTTPRRTYELLAGPPLRDAMPWERLHLFWGDERCVPPDHADSNYRLVHEALLAHVPIPARNVHRVPTEAGTPAAIAAHYERTLRGVFALEVDAVPRFDLILLGMGDDGHTASLFPESPALNEQTRWAVANPVEKLKTVRLTLTAPALNHAAHVLFIVTGAAKRQRLQEVIGGPEDSRRLPARLIRPARGAPEWYVDRAAAPTPTEA